MLGKPGRPVRSTDPYDVKRRAEFQARRLAHVCAWCERKLQAGRDAALCVECADYSTERQRVMRERRKKAKQCRECGKPTGGPARCRKCENIRNGRPSRTRAAQNAQHRRWYANAMRDPVKREARRAASRRKWQRRKKRLATKA